MKKIIASESVGNNAFEFVNNLQALIGYAPVDPEDVNIEFIENSINNPCMILFEESLSDGSKVYNIEIKVYV